MMFIIFYDKNLTQHNCHLKFFYNLHTYKIYTFFFYAYINLIFFSSYKILYLFKDAQDRLSEMFVMILQSIVVT